MKYYAVTDDINELYHYGVKGMKWGQHLFGDDLKPKSPGYKRAANKLRDIAKASKQSGRKDVETWSDRRYRQQVKKALARSALSKAKYGWDQVADGMHANEQAFNNAKREIRRNQKVAYDQNRYQQRLLRSEEKQAHKAAKAEKKFDRYLQDAREGRLRAGKLSNEQIQRINDRLNLERQARQLGGSEKASYRTRRREAIREGKLEGYKRGTAAGMEALAKGLVEMGIRSKIVKNLNNRSEARRQKVRNRIVNKKSHADIRRELRDKAYEEQIQDSSWYDRPGLRQITGTADAARRLSQIKSRKEQKEFNNRLQTQNYQNWLQQKKGESIEDYTRRIGNEARTGDVREALTGISYYDTPSTNKRTKTFYENYQDIRNVGKGFKNMGIAARDYIKGKKKTSVDVEPVGPQKGGTSPMSGQDTWAPARDYTKDKKAGSQKPSRNNTGYETTYQYLFRQIGRRPSEAEVKSYMRKQRKHK